MDRTEANTGTRDVAQHLRFDVATLERWMGDNVDGFNGPLTVSQFKGGQSNPTYRLDTPSGRAFVLRRKPPGKLLPGAHAVDREARAETVSGETFQRVAIFMSPANVHVNRVPSSGEPTPGTAAPR